MIDTHRCHSTNLENFTTKEFHHRLVLLMALFICFTFSMTFSMTVAAKLYKWVDDNGTTHYGETIPPKYANKSRSELSKSGRIVERKDILSPEERRANREAQEKKEAKKLMEERTVREKARRDRMLVNTYSNVAEIELARKRNLRQVELRINSLHARIKITNENLHDLQAEADGYTNKKQNLPASLKEDLITIEARLLKLKNDLGKPSAEKEALEIRFDEDKKRYRELTGK
ncbi:MAG: DUF4124 domain-containing protein [Gallionella sp.]